jgi:hypothetical protein
VAGSWIFTVALHYSVSVVYSGTVVCGVGRICEEPLWQFTAFFYFQYENDISMNFDIVKKMMPT